MDHKRVLVIGLGRFGSAIVHALWEAHAEVIVLDASPEAVEAVKDRSNAAFVGEAADADVLQGIGAADVDIALVTFGESFEATVLAVATLAKLGVQQIIARAGNQRQAEILKTVGASRVVQIESEMGRVIGAEVVTPISADLIEYARGYRVVPWAASGKLVGKTLTEVNLRQRYGINVVGFRRRIEGSAKPHLSPPDPNYRIAAGDTLMLVGEEANVSRFAEDLAS